MPDDANGNHSLPSGYLAVTGQTVQPSQHNPPLEDISACLTARLSRSGVAPMTGPLKTVTGSASAPAISPNNNPAVGIYWTTTGIAFAGTVAGTRYIGELIPYTFLTPEPLTVLPYGQTLLRASYPQLWAKAQTDIAAGNNFYNNGNGSTTFGIGDLRGRVIAGKDNMGGTSAGRISFEVASTTLGATGGIDHNIIFPGNLPQHTHSGTTGSMNRNASHSHSAHTNNMGTANVNNGQFGAYMILAGATQNVTVDAANTDHEHPFTTGGGNGLDGTPITNTPPVMICNYLLYVGA